ncbi:CAP domain-containing protein [Desertihabitans aurantiacus]|uniref:CAP domain-containing protein n=1 Tax=Desertihabitans aurantiacus TaxID=2282477 RepID=UPI000DF763FC|nr:CAP domain-containing protein [Desertihabitans aurantiacus]
MKTKTLARLASALVAGAASLTLLAPPAQAVTSTTYEADTIKYTNAERTKRSLGKVASNSCVDRYAERQAAAMAKSKRMYHQSLKPILTECKLSAVGENVAVGYTSGSSVVKAWMGSSGHRANILNSRYTRIGVGAVKGTDGRWYVAQVFGRGR